MNVKRLLKKGFKWYTRHDREILKGVSMAASVASMVLAWRARPKCEEVLARLEAEGASNIEKAKAVAPVIAPMLIAQGISMGTSLVEYKKTGEKLAGLVNAVSSYKALDDIRKEITKQQLTDEKIEEIDNEVVKKRLETASPEEIEETGHGDTLFIDPTYTGKVWHGSKDHFDLCKARSDNKLYACYDKYGSCIRDDFAVSFWDFFKELGLRVADFYDMCEYKARDYKTLPIELEPIEFEKKDGGTELGYKVVFTQPPTLAHSDLIDGRISNGR